MVRFVAGLTVLLFSVSSFAGLRLNVGDFWCKSQKNDKLMIAHTKAGRINFFENGEMISELYDLKTNIEKQKDGSHTVEFYWEDSETVLTVRIFGNEVTGQLLEDDTLKCQVNGY